MSLMFFKMFSISANLLFIFLTFDLFEIFLDKSGYVLNSKLDNSRIKAFVKVHFPKRKEREKAVLASSLPISPHM